MNSDQFKGRKGQKRLRELNERIDRILGETNERYQSSDEMSFILRSMPDPMVRLWFVSAYRVLDRHWGGIKDYGFLRLCQRWIQRKRLEEMSRPEAETMLSTILPAHEMQKVRERLAAEQEEEGQGGKSKRKKK